jgi:hypothetical protein
MALIGTISSEGLHFRNRIINGDMRIDQRNAGAAVTNITSSTYVVDRWNYFVLSSGSVDAQQDSDAPVGFKNSFKLTVNTTNSPSSNQGNAVFHRIEGYNMADFGFGAAGAKTITLSFWVKSSVTGTYVFQASGTLSTVASYTTTYTIDSANTWEHKTIIIPGDTGNTWTSVTNGTGITLLWGLGGGSGRYPTVLNTWTTEARFITATSTSTQWINNAGATFYITGVQLEVGSVATPFERRPYGTELMLCQRYYYRIKPTSGIDFYATGLAYSTTKARLVIPLKVSMRASPTALEQSGTASDYRLNDATASGLDCSAVPTFLSSSTEIAAVEFTVASGLVAGNAAPALSNTGANGFLAWSAEL